MAIKKHVPIENARECLHPFRQLMERHIYTGVQLKPQAVLAIYAIFQEVDDQLAQIGADVADLNIAHRQLLEIARDLDVVDREPGGGYQPRATGAGPGEPPHQGSGGQKDTTVVPFKPRPAPRPLYVPTGPGGAA